MTMNKQPTFTSQQLLEKMAQKLDNHTHDLLMSLKEISGDILQFLNIGVPVQIVGIGTFHVRERWDGSLQLEYQPEDNIHLKIKALLPA